MSKLLLKSTFCRPVLVNIVRNALKLNVDRKMCYSLMRHKQTCPLKNATCLRGLNLALPSLKFLHNVNDKAAENEPWIKIERRPEYVVSSPEKLNELIDGDKIVVIDVREPHEVGRGRVPAKRWLNIPIGSFIGSMNLPPEKFEQKFGCEKPTRDVVVMCQLGIRSTWALQVCQHIGISDSKHFPAGWKGWSEAYPEKCA